MRRFILDRADVVIQNLRPGAIDRYDICAEQLLRDKPSLVYCNLGAFGSVGPLATLPGYDPLMQAFGGLMSVTGEAGRAPVRIGPAVVDMGSGMWSVIGIMCALFRRQATGRGSVVDTSLFETALAWMTIITAGYLASGEVRQPMGSGIAEIVPHQALPTRDGFIMVAAGNDNLFCKLAQAVERPQWAEDVRFGSNDARVRNRADLIGQLEAIFAAAPSDEWARRLDAAGVPNAPIQSIDAVVAHPQTQALGILQQAPGIEMQLVGLPLRFDGQRPPFRRIAPDLGEHNAALGAAQPAAVS